MTTLKYRDGGAWKTLGVRGPAGSDGVGIPSGGSLGYLLRKKSATDYDTEWFNPPHCRVRSVTGTALSAGTWNSPVWAAGDFESHAGQMFKPGSSTTRLYVPPGITGYYQYRCCIGINYVAGNRMAIRMLKGDSSQYLEKTMAVATSTCSIDVEAVIAMPDTVGTNNNCYFQVYSQVTSSMTTAANYNWAEVRWVAPL